MTSTGPSDRTWLEYLLYIGLGVGIAVLALFAARLVLGQTPAHYRHRDGWLLPDSILTPGKVAIRDTQTVCHTLTSTERHTRESLKEHIREEYGGPAHPKPGTEEVDHLVPLTLGGADDSLNLWMQPANPRPGFKDKDRLEVWLYAEVCHGRLPLDSAQRWIVHDFPGAYRAMVTAKARE